MGGKLGKGYTKQEKQCLDKEMPRILECCQNEKNLPSLINDYKAKIKADGY